MTLIKLTCRGNLPDFALKRGRVNYNLAAIFLIIWQLLSLIFLPFHMAVEHHAISLSLSVFSDIPITSSDTDDYQPDSLAANLPTVPVDNCPLDIASHFSANVTVTAVARVMQLTPKMVAMRQRLAGPHFATSLLALAPKQSPPRL